MARRQKNAKPVTPAPLPRHVNVWINRIYGAVALCLLGLALMSILGIDAPVLRWVLIGILFLAGTGAIVLQARRVCPACGAVYGYHLRIVNANKCRRCGAELPPWRPGGEDTA